MTSKPFGKLFVFVVVRRLMTVPPPNPETQPRFGTKYFACIKILGETKVVINLTRVAL